MIEHFALGAALVGAGLAAGFLGGLFGVGGGIVLTPLLFHLFGALGADEAVRAHAAVATSLSTIIATSARSLSAHSRRGAVDWALLRACAPWIALGAAVGAGVAGVLSGEHLLSVFGVLALAMAAYLGLGDPGWRLGADVPGGAMLAGGGGTIGFLSALMGIGGGTFGVAAMTLFGRPIHQAVATASGFGAAIAVPATLGFVATGWSAEGRADWSLGYVHLPGFVILAALTAFAAPHGARFAHRLDPHTLRRAFALFLGVTGGQLLWEALAG